jgi:hypothetical protein
MKMFRKGLFFGLFIALCFSVFGQNEGDFSIQVSNGAVTITGYKGITKDVVIPERINGLPVVAIGSSVFDEAQLTSVVIPNSVKTIGDGAFAENRLTSVVIPNSVKTIGGSAFSYNQLTSVVIPNSVKFIGDEAFDSNVEIIRQ